MNHTTKALVSEVIVDQVRDQGTKARSVRNHQPNRGTAKLGKGAVAAAETVFERGKEAEGRA